MRDGMHPRARSGNRPVARGHGVWWLVPIALGSALIAAGCLHSASKTTDSGAPPPPSTSTSSPSASASTPAPAPAATGSPSPEFGTLPPPPPPPDPAPPAGSVATSEGWTTPSQGAQSTQPQTPGYRVQIFASSDRTKAESAAADARQRFTEPVYIEFEPPLYKVRVGDCATRHEADTLKERAGAQGYDGAWVAETQVRGH